MWERVGIIRCAESLGEARKKLQGWSFIQEKKFITRRELELKNMLTLAGLITESSILRKGSVGAHYRSDFPDQGDKWQKHMTCKLQGQEVQYGFID